jgi:hypothetical protein
VLVEKILEPGEELPTSWATAGTTGYDAMALIDRVLVDPAGEAPLDELESKLRGAPVDWPAMIHGTKREVTAPTCRSGTSTSTRRSSSPGRTGPTSPTCSTSSHPCSPTAPLRRPGGSSRPAAW